MWIISKNGMLNTDNLVSIFCTGNGATYASGTDGEDYLISDEPVVGDIAQAMIQGNVWVVVK